MAAAVLATAFALLAAGTAPASATAYTTGYVALGHVHTQSGSSRCLGTGAEGGDVALVACASGLALAFTALGGGPGSNYRVSLGGGRCLSVNAVNYTNGTVAFLRAFAWACTGKEPGWFVVALGANSYQLTLAGTAYSSAPQCLEPSDAHIVTCGSNTVLSTSN